MTTETKVETNIANPIENTAIVCGILGATTGDVVSVGYNPIKDDRVREWDHAVILGFGFTTKDEAYVLLGDVVNSDGEHLGSRRMNLERGVVEYLDILVTHQTAIGDRLISHGWHCYKVTNRNGNRVTHWYKCDWYAHVAENGATMFEDARTIG